MFSSVQGWLGRFCGRNGLYCGKLGSLGRRPKVLLVYEEGSGKAGAAGDQSTAPFGHHHAAGLTTFGCTSVGVSGVPALGSV